MTPPAAPRSLPLLAGFSALGLVAGLGWIWLPPVVAAVTGGRVPAVPEPTVGQHLALGVAATLLVYLLAATWFATPWYDRRGVFPALAGLVVYTGWQLVADLVASWRTHPWVQVVPRLIGLEQHSALVTELGTTLIAVVLLLVGAALLLTRPSQLAG